jgi:hypothetical protein
VLRRLPAGNASRISMFIELEDGFISASTLVLQGLRSHTIVRPALEHWSRFGSRIL